ncbi:MAG: prepilin-type N-terminal cleavage/methylation domain-containing protein [Kiritimatiellae bacterium]|nr:prepilin-type N-terminal cleavage/methylation domain-containing protein [Kiritimatiellia bacterium]
MARSGFTLVELLIAMAIAGLLVGVVYALYHTVMTAVSGRRVRDEELVRAGRAIDAVSADLAALFPAPGEEGRVRLGLEEPGATNRSDLAFCTLRLSPGEADSRWLEVRRVRYRLDPVGGEAGRLLCEHRPVSGPGAEAMATNELFVGAAAFRVRFYDGAEWQSEWEGTAEQMAPRAARIELDLPGENRSFRTEVLVHAGSVFTSRLARARAGP